MSNNHHKTSTIDDCKLISLAKHHHENGNLTVVENMNQLPYDIQRIYYLYDIPGGEERGGHSHHECIGFIVAVSGSFSIELYDGVNRKTVTLNRPYEGLLIAPGIWRTLNNFSSGSVTLVIASEQYCETDYVRTIEEYTQLTSNKQ